MTYAAKHTPGLWELYSPHPSEQYVDQIGNDGDYRKSIFRIHHDDDIPQTEAEANAHLVAAAPKLLAALRWVIKNMSPYDLDKEGREQWAVIGRAIAKAENRGS
jgi:hypothetical protein